MGWCVLMSYIWQEYSKQNRYKVTFEKISPYLEVWYMNDKNNISVNPFIRINRILFPDPDSETDSEKIIELSNKYESEENYIEIANLIIHEIAQFDRLKGIDLLYVLGDIERKNIEEVKYGSECATLFNAVSDKKKQDILLRYLAKYDMTKQRESMFDSALNALFNGVKMYYERSTDHVHIYIDEPKSDDNENLYSLVSLLFKDINIKDEVTWNNHFGIIGFDAVMIQDEIQII